MKSNIMPWNRLSERLSQTPGSRVFVTGTDWRYHPDDREPNAIWYAQASPEERYGPRKAAGQRETAYRVRDAGSRAPQVAGSIISELFRQKRWKQGA